ncbi:hypothetical protein [uncultured Draconibacterium sp.]|uniref:hypothetical protein n=1 Tax=uncultured Draconibacterium sp. TaxID=1573823 RepID=UPI002AA647B7|nr:hypothetical protein [uncultured Draconibacterium sp.]
MRKSINRTLALVYIFLLIGSFYAQSQDKSSPVKLNLTNLEQVAEVEERFQSINVEMCEVVGGDFWIPYELVDVEKVKAEGFAALKRTIPAVNLYDKKLRTLASALGPMYIRVSGTWANTTFFQDNNEPKLETAPDGYENVLTRAEWKGVIDFCNATNSKLVTSFAISDGIRDEDGNWTPAQIESLINFTKSLGGEIYAAEMFNEPSHAGHGGAPDGYDATWYARDFELFKDFVDAAYPEMKILGPGSTGEGGLIPGGTISTDDIMKATPNPEFEVFTYHYYGGVSQRCRGGLTPENALTKEWLSKTELGLKYYEDARNKYQPGAPIWLTETAEAACGGNPWASTYVDCFRYLEQLGRLAKKNVQVVMHNTLCASEYALLEQETHDPRPNYWAALLWNKFMGTKVYNTETKAEGPDIFIHNLKNSTNGFAVLIVNPEVEQTSINIPVNAEKYLLTADEILSKSVQLNGEILKLNSDNTLPEIKGENINAGEMIIPGQSILFLTFNQNQ